MLMKMGIGQSGDQKFASAVYIQVRFLPGRIVHGLYSADPAPFYPHSLVVNYFFTGHGHQVNPFQHDTLSLYDSEFIRFLLFLISRLKMSSQFLNVCV